MGLKKKPFLICCTVLLSLLVNTALADRVKDLTNVGGVRGNQLIGYGLVVGLAGTGDGKDPTFTGQSLKAILESLGVTTNPYDDYDLAQSRGRPLQVDNVAAVMVTATLSVPSRVCSATRTCCVSRSWTCGRCAKNPTRRLIFDKPMTFSLGI